MPPKKEGSKLHSFVHRDASPEDFEDLKMAPPRISNSSITRSKSQLQAQSHNAKGQSAPGQPRRPSDGRPTFYDTDASEADKTSTSVSTRRAKTGAGRAQQPQTQARGLMDSSSGEEGSEEEDGSDEGLVSDPLAGNQRQNQINGQLNQKQRKLLNKHTHEKAARADGITSKYVEGDSYPPTTSGRPSASDLGERATLQSAQQERPALVTQPSQVGRQSDMRAPLGPQSAQNPAAARRVLHDDAQQTLVDLGLDRLKSTIAPADLMQDVNAAFIFSKAPQPKQQLATRPLAPQRRQAPPQASGPQQSLSVSAAQHGSRPAANPEHAATRATAHQGSTMVPDDVTAPQEYQKKRSKSKHVSRAPTPVQPPIQQTAPEPEPLSDHAYQDENAQPNGFQPEYEQQAEPKTELDYDPSIVYTMDYRALKAAKFDIDPNAAAFAMPDDLPANTLAEQLTSVSRLESADQAHFMSTLDIEQWEEAGEWFLGCFGQLMSRFRTARQDKRRAARRFEDEVEKRHEAVSKKRKSTEDALGEMKASGAQVLQGTPKKVRKTK